MRRGIRAALVALGFGMVSFVANAELFRHSSEPKPLAIQIADSAYAGRGAPGGRIAVEGRQRIARVVIGADKAIIRFDFDYATERGTVDELQHGLAKPQQSSHTAQLAYDRTTGLIAFQTIAKEADPTADTTRPHSTQRDNREGFLIAQPMDPAILEFLDAVIDHVEALDKYYQKRGDCGAAEAAKTALPLQHLATALPPDHVLYARNLGLPPGCEAVWQQIQFGFNSIFELVDPLNPGSGGYRTDYAPGPTAKDKLLAVVPNSRIGDLDSAITAKMLAIAKLNEFHPINYDLAAAGHEFELAPNGEALVVKRRQELNLNVDADLQHTTSRKPDFTYTNVPTLVNIQDVLVELRSEKFKAYQRSSRAIEKP